MGFGWLRRGGDGAADLRLPVLDALSVEIAEAFLSLSSLCVVETSELDASGVNLLVCFMLIERKSYSKLA